MRTLPPVSEPSPISTRPAATADADPELDPPEQSRHLVSNREKRQKPRLSALVDGDFVRLYRIREYKLLK